MLKGRLPPFNQVFSYTRVRIQIPNQLLKRPKSMTTPSNNKSITCFVFQQMLLIFATKVACSLF